MNDTQRAEAEPQFQVDCGAGGSRKIAVISKPAPAVACDAPKTMISAARPPSSAVM